MDIPRYRQYVLSVAQRLVLLPERKCTNQGKPFGIGCSCLLFQLFLQLVDWFSILQRVEMSGEITERRYKNDQEIAADKQREDQLQTYLDRMPELLLNNQLSKLPP